MKEPLIILDNLTEGNFYIRYGLETLLVSLEVQISMPRKGLKKRKAKNSIEKQDFIKVSYSPL